MCGEGGGGISPQAELYSPYHCNKIIFYLGYVNIKTFIKTKSQTGRILTFCEFHSGVSLFLDTVFRNKYGVSRGS